MIIDIHGHYTTEPQALGAFRDKQVAGILDPARRPLRAPRFTDDELIASVQPQLALQRERGTDLTIFSPRASAMGHHVGPEAIGQAWTQLSNDLIHRICTLLPDNFAAVGQLPQMPGVSPANCVAEMRRCVELGFVGFNLNPDPSGGYWRDPPMIDRYWYPVYEALCELKVPAMIHVTGSCNPNFHATGAHYINGDTTVFMQLIQGDLFRDFPELKLVIPHGGGAAPYHWGRYRGIAQDMGKPALRDHLLSNLFFDTCVYHQPGIDLLAGVIPVDNILFASELLGAVKSRDPETGEYFDDTKRYIDALPELDAAARAKIFEGNARRVYPLLDRKLRQREQPVQATAAENAA
jgi:4-oxalmesaconate hydratase